MTAAADFWISPYRAMSDEASAGRVHPEATDSNSNRFGWEVVMLTSPIHSAALVALPAESGKAWEALYSDTSTQPFLK